MNTEEDKILKMTTNNSSSQFPVLPSLFYALILGLVGFICGFFGNALLADEPSNIAPVVGIIETGPIGFIFGIILGITLRVLRLKYLIISAILVAVISLARVSPGYKPVAELIEGRVVSCEPDNTLVSQRLSYWRSEVERVTRDKIINPRDNWEATVEPMVNARPGMIISIERKRGAWIVARTWRWGQRDRKQAEWVSSRRIEKYFIDQAVVKGLDMTHEIQFLGKYEKADGNPPPCLPEYLGLPVIRPVPPNLNGDKLKDWVFSIYHR
jgi:hypothetical protein